VRSSSIRSSWKLGPKSIHRIHLVCVIVLNNSQHGLDGCSVLINEVLRVKVVQRLRVIHRAVGEGVVNGHMNTDLTSSKDVVKERHSWSARELFDNDLVLRAFEWHRLPLGRLEIHERHRALSYLFVVSILLIAVNLDKDLFVIDSITQGVCVNYHSEFKPAILLWGSFSLVHWVEFSLAFALVDQSKYHSCVVNWKFKEKACLCCTVISLLL